jgi:hypothetical protein
MLIVILLVSNSFNAYLDSSLAFIGLTRGDLVLRNDYSMRDQYRFPIVDSLLLNPLNSVDVVLGMDEDFWNESLKNMFESMVKVYGLHAEAQRGHLFGRLEQCYAMVQNAIADKEDELGPVMEKLTVFAPEPTGSIEEEKAYEEEYDSLVSYLAEHADLIDYQSMFAAALTLLHALEDFSVSNIGLPDFEKGGLLPGTRPSINGVNGGLLYYNEFDFGRVVIGDSGVNVYDGDFAVIIDLGGDDIYYSATGQSYFSLIIDEAGDDRYHGGDYGVACGRFGVSILIDNGGDDIYEAQSFSLGAGVFGVGILFDRKGDDRYRGDTFTQGAAGFGIGILRDEAGNDTYEGALYAQGFAATYGIGILGDGSGNDQYLIEEKYLDEIRYLDHYLSMSQGFSIGFRPDLSAGIGLLFEKSGNDQYVADIFGQAASYWYGIGAIVEHAGNDNYIAYQYAQGSGIHIALGVLIDEAGDDNYVAKGVSQGCGHDLSLGFLLDKSGSDTYAAFDLSQGAGSANGIGVLVDEQGDDTYAVKRQHNTQGYGDFRREYGSIGVLLDLFGADSYSSGKDQEFWLKGKYGIGVDWY